jgi:hypothetical protein
MLSNRARKTPAFPDLGQRRRRRAMRSSSLSGAPDRPGKRASQIAIAGSMKILKRPSAT